MIRSAGLKMVPAQAPRWPLLDQVLSEQRELSAVQRFAQKHEEGSLPAHARHYQDLLPATAPGPGQQYAFDVDLDVCTGCKACVAACHSLNGLDEGEVWRTVGLLHGGSPSAPAQQTVTTSCHHCVDPACLKGCPVKAYEKDPVTGIVKHLDDQCIGCQYCTLMCPYDAPKYSPSRGIVRKCDMCSDRLSSGEAPACVQACPNGAIRISVVDQAQSVQASEAGTFLPGAPAPDQTIPTTIYRSKRDLPRNLLPADFYTVSPEHAHLPLVVMLLLTQLAVGAFVASLALERVFAGSWARTSFIEAMVPLAFAILAIGAATFHLGRPRLAFRAVLGLRTSWMSREILAFGLFAKTAALYALTFAPWPAFPALLRGLSVLVRGREAFAVSAAVFGLGGVFCSAMVYAATGRAQWRGAATSFRFFASTVILGAAGTAVLQGLLSPSGAGAAGPLLLGITLVVGAGKLLFDASALRHLAGRAHTVGKRVALLMVGDLRSVTLARFIAGTGGLVAGLYSFMQPPASAGSAGLAVSAGSAGSAGPVWLVTMFILLAAGESCERYLFFRAAPPSRMPGALA